MPPYSPELLELADALARDRVDEVSQRLRESEFDDDALWSFLREGRLRGFACPLLDDEDFVAAAPERFVRRLNWYRADHDRRGEQLAHLLAKVDDAFSAAGLEYLLLKGAGLAQRLYPRPAARQQYDLDVLIHRQQLETALAALQAAGLSLKHNRATIAQQKLRTEHAMTLYAEEGKVDMHWCLRSFPVCNFDEPRIFATSVPITVAGRQVQALSEEYALALLLVSIADDLRENMCRLKHWFDLRMALERFGNQIDWPAFLERRREEGVLSLAVNVLALLEYVFPDLPQRAMLAEIIAPYRELIAFKTPAQARRLLTAPRESVTGLFWFLRAYPSPGWREAVWMLDRQVPTLSRLPRLLGCSLRFTWRTFLYATALRA